MSKLNKYVILVGLALAGCGADDSDGAAADTSHHDKPGTHKDAGAPEADAGAALPHVTVIEPRAAPKGMETLIEGDWSLEAGQEAYFCTRLTIEEDAFASAFEPIAPLGTHHGVLSVGYASGLDGTKECDDPTQSNGNTMLYGYGVGTPVSVLPEGVAVKLQAGRQLMLNAHVFNTTDKPLTGNSGVRFKRVDAAHVEHEAEAVLMGTTTLTLPPGKTTVQLGQCTLAQDATLFAVGPHMHKLGRYQRVWALRKGQPDLVLFDGPYDFDRQDREWFEPLSLHVGDRIRVECTYDNDTDHTVTYGQSTRDEMCYAGVLRYPAVANGIGCVN